MKELEKCRGLENNLKKKEKKILPSRLYKSQNNQNASYCSNSI